MFRTRFVLFWLLVNGLFYVATLSLVNLGDDIKYIDHDSGYLSYFAMAMAATITFRISAAMFFIIRWKVRYNCCKKYKIKPSKKNLVQPTTADTVCYTEEKCFLEEA